MPGVGVPKAFSRRDTCGALEELPNQIALNRECFVAGGPLLVAKPASQAGDYTQPTSFKICNHEKFSDHTSITTITTQP